MRLQAERGFGVLILAATLLLGVLGGAATATRALTPSGVLHPQLVTGPTPSLKRSQAPRHLPLRVPDRGVYQAAKTAAKRSYQAWRKHDGSTPRSAETQAFAPSPSTPSSPRAGLMEGLNQPGLVGNEPRTQVTPPDSTGAIGPSHYVEIVNSQIAVYDRTNLSTPLTTEGEDEFTTGTETCDGQIRWDQQAERWEYASLDCGKTPGFSFGWSKSADPTDLAGGWCKYHESTGAILYDYPKLGGDNDYLLLGANKFDMTKEEEYVGSSLLVIPKPLTGGACPPAPTATEFEVPVFTPVPANVFGSSTTGYAVAADSPTNAERVPNHLRLFTVTTELLKPVVSESAVSVSGFTVPASVPQPGTSDEIDSSDTRLTQAVAMEDPTSHEMAIWTQHTVATTLGPSIVRWYELKPGSSSPAQEGTIKATDGNFVFNAAISPTIAGDRAVIDYNVGGPGMLVQLRAQSHVPQLAPGAMAGEVTLAQSSAADQDFSCPSVTKEEAPCRWGDYAGASPDPSHPEVVWGSSQFDGPLPPLSEAHAPQWRTENFALTADLPPVASFTTSPASPTPGTPVSFDGSTSTDLDGTIASYEWSFGDGSPNQTGAMPSHTYASAGSYTVTLTVTDDAGLTGSVERTVLVEEPPPPSPPPSPPSTTVTQTVTNTFVTTINAIVTRSSAKMRVLRIEPNKRTGAVALTLQIPDAGRLQIGDGKAAKKARRGHKRPQALVKPLRMRLTQAGIVTVQLLPSALARRLLAHKRAIPIRALIVFTPNGGRAVSLTKSLVLEKTAQRRK